MTTDPFIPVANPLAQYQAHRAQIRKAVDDVLEGGLWGYPEMIDSDVERVCEVLARL